MIDFLNDITGGNLLLWKVVLTSIVFALAGLQGARAARTSGVAAGSPRSPTASAACHTTSRSLSWSRWARAVRISGVAAAGPRAPTA